MLYECRCDELTPPVFLEAATAAAAATAYAEHHWPDDGTGQFVWVRRVNERTWTHYLAFSFDTHPIQLSENPS